MSPLTKDKLMTHKLRFALTAVLLVALVGGGAGAAAADSADRSTNVDSTTVVNDHDLVDVDDTLNDLNTNVLGIANQDSPIDIL